MGGYPMSQDIIKTPNELGKNCPKAAAVKISAYF